MNNVLDPNETFRFVSDKWDASIIPALKEYIRIPNKSPAFDPEWEAHGYMDEAVELLTQWLDANPTTGLSYEVCRLSGRTPTLFAEVEASPGYEDRPPVFLYGHYDKQPEFDGWEEGLGPWIPVERDGKLYGRGGADDGYAMFGSVAALQALQAQGIPHPRCVLFIEGCEESGSFDLPFYVEHLKDRIGHPSVVVCLDAGCANYDQLWVTTSLRGMVIGTLTVKVISEGQHSGLAGGIVPSTFRILRSLMERIENSDTGEMLPSLYVDIPQSAIDAAHQVAQIVGTEVYSEFPWLGGVSPTSDSVADLVLANCWEPSLATVGLSGAPNVENAGNTLRPETSAKLAIRLPPTLDAETAGQTIKSILETDPPYGAHVEFDCEQPMSGWCAPEEDPWLAAALSDTSQSYFGKPVGHMGLGGGIPFMKMLGDAYPGTQFVVTGVLGPASNAHGPNEFLHIETGKRVTASMAEVIARAALLDQ